MDMINAIEVLDCPHNKIHVLVTLGKIMLVNSRMGLCPPAMLIDVGEYSAEQSARARKF